MKEEYEQNNHSFLFRLTRYYLNKKATIPLHQRKEIEAQII